MCGIVGYVGNKQAAPILLDGLTRLEYRGYDSAGIAVRNGSGEVDVVKAKGRLKNLYEKTDNGHSVPGTCGIGHTRWATHGEPSETNAHPHISDDGNVSGVHNGIIENYQELREKLTRHGYVFYSQTDTEIAIKLIDYYYKKYNIGPVDAITKTMVRVRGSYALAVMFKDYPGEIWVARKDSPMVIGTCESESFAASDVTAILNYTRDVYYIDNLELACLKPGEVHFYDLNGDEIQKKSTRVEWDAKAAERGGFEHFMIKEIHEQPKAVSDTIAAYVKETAADGGHSGQPSDESHEGSVPGAGSGSAQSSSPSETAKKLHIDLSASGLTDEVLKDISQVYITACGSAYHVGVAVQYVIEDLARIPVRVELASEFRYRRPILDKNGLVVIISQSGETADSLAALREAKALGLRTLAIVNVVGSSIAREADNCIYTLAGPEIAVATTKAYSTQLIVGYCLALQLAKVKGTIEDAEYERLLSDMCGLSQKIEKVLDDKERIQWFASKFANAKDIFFLGRGIDYAISLEGSLKLKEISYIHSEAYAAGELKHGTISLIENNTLVIGTLTQSSLYEKTVSNMVECKARGAYLMGLTTYGNYAIEDSVDFTCYIPKCDEHFATSLAIIVLQLLSYYISVAKGLDVDKPRNLAKSVTVE
ncbi:MAG: glutamine--fructose-6-phosphate aminotransferase [Lachnospiraceae bacterium]|nr:glutamine--fructose-6-phosphate aminotransferase [Lachnospiraceae bacterium]